jgi:Ni/Fe-hydrogenase 1 B-type cytochrome subunit
MSNHIQRIAIYSKAQRITHWLMAGGSIFLLISAWLIEHSDVDILAWTDWHIMLGQALSVVLAFRLYLLFQPGSGHWRLLIPTREQRHIVLQTIKFYASLGRLPCPDWYAYNPLWQPLYLLLITTLLITTISGYLIGHALFFAGLPMTQLHGIFATLVLYFSLVHPLFAVIHDVKGQGAQISALLNGYKYFQSKSVDNPLPKADNSVSLQSLLKK